MTSLNLIDQVFFIKKLPLFHYLEPEALFAIADKLQPVMFKPNATIFAMNEEGKNLFFIFEGLVKLQIPGKPEIEQLKPGHFFGEEALFGNKPRSYSAIASIESYLLTLSRTDLYTIISECPSVALAFLEDYASMIGCRACRSP